MTTILRKAVGAKTKQLLTHLHRHNAIVDNDFLCEEISANCRLVLIGEAFVHILIHQRRLADTRVAQYDDLKENLLSGSHDCRSIFWKRKKRKRE